MQISGLIRTTCPPAFLLDTLRNPAALTQLLPEGSKVDQTGDGTYAFTVTKGIGPIKLTLPGKLTLTAQGRDFDQHLVAHAAHLIGGKVDLDLIFEIARHDGQTRLAYDGDLSATGLAGRILNEHRARANSLVKSGLTRLRLYAEKQFAQSQPAA